MKAESYAVNTTTIFAFVGLGLFGLLELICMFNAVVRLILSVWMYSVEGYSFATAGKTFFTATISFVMAVLCHKAFRYCLSKLRKYRI